MSAQTKQTMIYGVGIPFGERPRSPYMPVISPGVTDLYVEVPSVSVSIGQAVSQRQAGIVWTTGLAGINDTGINVYQKDPASIELEGKSPGVAEVYTQGGAGAVTTGVAQKYPAVVWAEPLYASLVVQPVTITADSPAEVYAEPGPGSGGTDISQKTPGSIVIEPGPGAGGYISQREPAIVYMQPNPGSKYLQVRQDDYGAILIEPETGVVWRSYVFVQRQPGVIWLTGKPGGEQGQGQIILTGDPGVVTPDKGQVDVPEIIFEPGPGAATRDVAQKWPAIIWLTGDPSQTTIDPATPIEIVQDDPAELYKYPKASTTGIGEEPLCRWFAPADCLNEAKIAHRIMYKQPSESIWLAYNFQNRLADDEEISKVLEVDDGDLGLIDSALILGWYDSFRLDEVKYRVSGGTAGTNVRIEHRVLTTNGRTLEGDGYLYIREIL